MKLLSRHVALVVPHRQFSDEEYADIRSVLEREGCRMNIAGASLQPATGMRGATVRPRLLFSDVRPDEFDALVFIGGTGARDFWAHPRAHNLVRAFDARGKILAAICTAPVTLARAGVLARLPATCHPGARRELEAAGATYTPQPVVTSGRILTGSGPQAARAFAETLADFLANGTAA